MGKLYEVHGVAVALIQTEIEDKEGAKHPVLQRALIAELVALDHASGSIRETVIIGKKNPEQDVRALFEVGAVVERGDFRKVMSAEDRAAQKEQEKSE